MESEKPFVKSPAFQIYPADFLADKNTLVMSAAEVGAYWLLLCVCWRENGLPDDVEELAGLARTPLKQFQVSWSKRIQRCFIQRDDGKWTHNRLQKERDKQETWRQKSSEGGRASATKRTKGGSRVVEPKVKRLASTVVEPDSNSSFSSLSSSSFSSSPSGEKKERPAKKQQDERTGHPALVAIREVKGRFPSKDVWDLVIDKVGSHPNVPRMKECWLEWRGRNYAPENLGWLVDWYLNGIPPPNGNRGGSKVDHSMAAVRQVLEEYKHGN